MDGSAGLAPFSFCNFWSFIGTSVFFMVFCRIFFSFSFFFISGSNVHILNICIFFLVHFVASFCHY